MVKSGWNKLALVIVTIPVAMFKNAVRIVAISLLAIHVDLRFLNNSSLHQEGRILFCLLGLLLLSPLLWLLQKTERRPGATAPRGEVR